MTERELLIEYANTHLCDVISYDNPNYWELLREMCEEFADMMSDCESTLKQEHYMEIREFKRDIGL